MRPSHRGRLAGVLILLLLGPGVVPSRADAPALLDWIRARAHPIRTVSPTDDAGDLRFLDEAVQGVRVVLVGEEIHGVREFLLFRHRVIRYLVEHHSFTTVALEQDSIRGEELDHYLKTGEGDPSRTLATCYWCWNNKEVLELLTWLRHHNATSERPVSLVGIDNQTVTRAAQRLRSLAAEIAESTSLDVAAALDPFSVGRKAYQKLPEAPREAHARAIARLREELNAGTQTLIAATSRKTWSAALDAVGILEQVLHLWSAPNTRVRMNRRDRQMARRVEELVRDEHSRVIVWAHNAHVSRALFYGGVEPLGLHVAKTVPSLAVGVYFGCGEYLHGMNETRAISPRRLRALLAPRSRRSGPGRGPPTSGIRTSPRPHAVFSRRPRPATSRTIPPLPVSSGPSI